MLKYLIDSLEGVSEEHHGLYAEKEGGGYQLAVDGVEDTSALKRAKEHEKEGRKAAEAKNRELQTQVDEFLAKAAEEADNKHRKNKDVDALENSWKEKFSNRETELTGHIDSLKDQVKNLLVDTKAASMAAEISTSPNLVLPHITSRLTVEYDDNNKPHTRVLDADGKPSALTVEDLQKEIAAREDFQTVIIGSNASGGGANASKNGGGASKVDFSKMSVKEKKAYLKSKRGD